MELLCFIHLASKFDTLYFFLISSSPTCHILSIATWRERLGNLQEGKRGVGGGVGEVNVVKLWPRKEKMEHFLSLA